jgi:hypothetical protein
MLVIGEFHHANAIGIVTHHVIPDYTKKVMSSSFLDPRVGVIESCLS